MLSNDMNCRLKDSLVTESVPLKTMDPMLFECSIETCKDAEEDLNFSFVFCFGIMLSGPYRLFLILCSQIPPVDAQGTISVPGSK